MPDGIKDKTSEDSMSTFVDDLPCFAGLILTVNGQQNLSLLYLQFAENARKCPTDLKSEKRVGLCFVEKRTINLECRVRINSEPVHCLPLEHSGTFLATNTRRGHVRNQFDLDRASPRGRSHASSSKCLQYRKYPKPLFLLIPARSCMSAILSRRDRIFVPSVFRAFRQSRNRLLP